MEEQQEVTRDARGRWINAPPSPAPFTQANARSNAKKRWRKTEKAIADAVMSEITAFMPSPATTPRAALAHIAAKQAATLMDSEHPRMDDLEKLGQLMGEVPRTVELRSKAAEAGPQSDALSVIGAALVEYIRRVDAIPAQIHETIDGDTVE